jgi:UDP-glucose 4-epimerase
MVKVIAVTGGAGFVGTNLILELVRAGYQVRAIDDFSTGLKMNLSKVECEVVEASVTDFESMKKALKGCEYIFHLAARGSVPRSIKNPRATMEVNVTGTLNILECARDIGAAVAFSSSSSVYGSNTQLPKNEEMWTAPLTPYAASKLAGEGLVQSYASSFGVTAINYRFFNIFGPWQRPDHDYAAVIPKWIWKLMNGHNQIDVFGDGTQSRDFAYVSSVTGVLLDGLERKLNHPGPINLAFGEKISLNDLIGILRKYFPNIEARYLEPRLGDVKNSQNDPAKLFNTFPRALTIDFDKAIKETIEWFLKNGNRIVNGPKVSD